VKDIAGDGRRRHLEDLDFSPREVIAAMIERGFPTALYRDEDGQGHRTDHQRSWRPTIRVSVQSQEGAQNEQALLDGFLRCIFLKTLSTSW